MGPQNGILGNNATSPTAMPQTQVPQDSLVEERQMASFNNSPEWQKLVVKMQQRVKYWEQYVPGNSGHINIKDLPNDERGWRWLAADSVITELQSIIAGYQSAADVVAAADKAKQ